jgi:uncharacterized protein (TIGR02569 family)
MMRRSPPASVVRAFGGDADALCPLAGGQGTSWRAGRVVLKPAEATSPYGWVADELARLPDTAAFRLARPVASAGGEWVVGGWSASAWVGGRHVAGRWREKLAVSAALHAALAAVDVTGRAWNDSPWAIGARVAWSERPAPDGLGEPVTGELRRLRPRLDEPWRGPGAQLIHGDLAGNVVFADGLPPAVIDMSPHLAPAPFADAVLVADAVAWAGAGTGLARWFAATAEAGRQLLARAVAYRLVAVALLHPDDQDRAAAEVTGYAPVTEIALAG